MRDGTPAGKVWTRGKWVLGVGISAVLLWLACREVSWTGFVAGLGRADPLRLASGVLLCIAVYVMFALRWKLILGPLVEVSVVECFDFIMIGHLVDTVLPLRAGDIGRAALLGSSKQKDAATIFASVVVERILDILALLVLAGIVLPSLPRAQMLVWAVQGIVAVAAAAVLVAVLILRFQRVLPLLERAIGRMLPRRLARVLLDAVNGFADGLVAVRQSPHPVRVLALSLGAWAAVCASTLLYLHAFHLHLPWYGACFVVLMVNLGSAVPSSPGFIGVYHFLVVTALATWVPSKDLRMSYAVAAHAIGILTIIGLGGTALVRRQLRLSSILHRRERHNDDA